MRVLFCYNVDVLCFEINSSIPWYDCEITGIDFDMNVISLVKINITVHSFILWWLWNYCDDIIFLGDDSEMNERWLLDDSGKWLTDYCEMTG